jgi:hypothetical protein
MQTRFVAQPLARDGPPGFHVWPERDCLRRRRNAGKYQPRSINRLFTRKRAITYENANVIDAKVC